MSTNSATEKETADRKRQSSSTRRESRSPDPFPRSRLSPGGCRQFCLSRKEPKSDAQELVRLASGRNLENSNLQEVSVVGARVWRQPKAG
jgi:hypothetical protein